MQMRFMVLVTMLVAATFVLLARATAVAQPPDVSDAQKITGSEATADNSSAADADSTAASASEWTFTGQLGGGMADVAMLDHYALLGVGPRIAVIDVAEPEKPRWASMGPLLTDTVRGITVDGARVYVAAGEGGLFVLDAADPLDLRVLGSIDLPDAIPGIPSLALDVQVQRGFAYVAMDDVGLRVVDVRDPARPVTLGALDKGRAIGFRLAITGSTLLMVGQGLDGSGPGPGVWAIDIREPGHPLLTTVVTSFVPRDIALFGTHALVANLDGTLGVLDVTDPQHPTTVASLELGSGLRSVAVHDSIAYVGDVAGTVYVVDLADPTLPRRVTRVGEPQARPVAVMAVAALGGTVCAASLADIEALDIETPDMERVVVGVGWMEVIDATAPDRAHEVARVRVPSGLFRDLDIARDGRSVWVIDSNGANLDSLQPGDIPDGARNAVIQVDVMDPSRPRMRASWQPPGEAQPVALAVVTPYVYVLAAQPQAASQLYIVDMSDPNAPIVRLVSGFEGPEIEDIHGGGISDMTIVDQHMLISASGRLAWLDISDPSEPRVLDVLAASWPTMVATDLVASEPLVYVFENYGGWFSILDFRDPANPRLAAQWFSGDTASGGAVVGRTMLTAGDDHVIRVIDTSNWASIREVGQVTLDKQDDIAITAHADRAFTLGNSWVEMNVLDVSNPALPVVIQTVEHPPSEYWAGGRQFPYGPIIVATAGRVYANVDGLGLLIYTPAPGEIPPPPVRDHVVYLPLALRDHQRPPTSRPRKLAQVLNAWRPEQERSITSREVAAAGTRVFMGTSIDCAGTLHVIDVARPAAPAQVGRVELALAPIAVRVVDDRAYVVGSTCGAEGSGALAIVDVSNADQPRLLGRVGLPWAPVDVAVHGNRAYMVDADDHNQPFPSVRTGPPFVRIIDVADPAAPHEVGRFLLENSRGGTGIAAVDGYALVTDFDAGLRIIDVANPAAPHQVATFTIPSASDVVVDEDRAFVISQVSGISVRRPMGLWIVDIGDPTRPRGLGALADIDDDFARWLGGVRVTVAGGVAYVGAGNWLRAIDVRDPAWPVLLDVAESRAIGVAAMGGRVFAVHEGGLSIFDLVDR